MNNFHRLAELIVHWDKSHTDYLEELYDVAVPQADAFIVNLISLLPHEQEIQEGGTWLVKFHVAKGKKLPPEAIASLLNAFTEFTDWPAQLHVLQVIPCLPIPKDLAEQVLPTVERLLSSHAVFVRAASYEAYWELLNDFSHAKPAFLERCEQALKHERPSVLVKIRRILTAIK